MRGLERCISILSALAILTKDLNSIPNTNIGSIMGSETFFWHVGRHADKALIYIKHK